MLAAAAALADSRHSSDHDTMNALRLHKGTVPPGPEKMREARRRLQATRQRAARDSLVQGLRTFLTADSFMYGPLLQDPPPDPSPPTVDHAVHHPRLSDDDDDDVDSELRTPDDGSTRDNVDVTEGRQGETINPSKDHVGAANDETPRTNQASRSTKTSVLSVQRTSRTGRTSSTVAPPAVDGLCRTLTSTVRVIFTAASTISNEQVEGDELVARSLLLGDEDEAGVTTTSSMTTSYDDEDLIPLDTETACKVVQTLVTKVGGRYSTELGVNVDAGDEQVEQWFLAVTLFHRHLTFDVLKTTFQKLESAGIVSVRGMLHREEDDIADMLETTGYTTYKHRAAARIRKLAVQLETEYDGRVSSLKHMQDAHELCRHISNLHGLTTNTCHVFLRELRGVWPGAAAMEYDRRTKRAAMHLRIAHQCDQERSTKSSALINSHMISLKQIAHEAGVDERDLEVALVRLGLAHERHYHDCPVGPGCTFLTVAPTAHQVVHEGYTKISGGS